MIAYCTNSRYSLLFLLNVMAKVATEGDPTVQNCTFRDGQGCVCIHDKGKGTFIGNIFSDPQDNILEIHDNAGTVVRRNNRPNR